MRLTKIVINNFRGIKHTSVNFPKTSRIVCLIGPGDSGKSTILSAIEWVLWPTWNVNATDLDFYNCDTSEPIEIIASITELPKELLTEDKYGLYQRDIDYDETGNDEPIDNKPTVLTIRLTVNDDLEPKWEVITNRVEPKTISHKDRRILSFGIVGSDHEKDFQWGRNSVLQKYSDSQRTIRNAFTQAMRVAIKKSNLDILDQVIHTLTKVGQEYGVGFSGDLHNGIFMQNGSYSTTVGVFDGKVPFTQRGLGSKRLLSIGMNVNAFKNGTLTLVDEVENGLEPYRISTLINQFRIQFKESGQLIMTTHSVSTLCECSAHEVGICTSNSGDLKIHFIENFIKRNIINQGNIQALLRRNPDAFLCKKVIVCEGKTEIGILRALDKYRASKKMPRFAHYGVSMIPSGGGDNFFTLAKLLHECGYTVSVLMDSDDQDEDANKQKIIALGIAIFDWEKGLAIEEQLFKDVSLECVNAMISIAVEEKSFDHVKSKLAEKFSGNIVPYSIQDKSITIPNEISKQDRIAIGSVAKNKKSGWFKNTSIGEMIGEHIFKEFDSMHSCHFKNQMINLQKWVETSEA